MAHVTQNRKEGPHMSTKSALRADLDAEDRGFARSLSGPSNEKIRRGRKLPEGGRP
jgi:hypothetical protein